MFYGTAFSLLPPLLAIILALVTKHVYLSLFAGVFLGALMIGGFSFWPTFSALYTAMTENFDTPIILFLILLSIDIVLMQKSGATMAYSDWAAKHIRSKRAAMLATSALGLLIFVDDGFNCLTIGSVMRPVTDRYRVSRAKLAYIIDAISSMPPQRRCASSPRSRPGLPQSTPMSRPMPGSAAFISFFAPSPTTSMRFSPCLWCSLPPQRSLTSAS